jgi:hypothetical protein
MKITKAIEYARSRAASYDNMIEYADGKDEIEYFQRNADMLRTLCNEVERLQRLIGGKRNA